MTTLPAEKRPSKPRRVTGKLRVALDAMVHEALEMDQAAMRAGLTTRNLRQSLRRPWVLNYMREQRALLLNELAGQNAAHLRTLRSSSPNAMTRLGAVRTIEDLAQTEATAGQRRPVTPGITINIVQNPPAPTAPHTVDGNVISASYQAVDEE